MTAVPANESARPAQPLKVVQAVVVSAEPGKELAGRSRVVRARDWCRHATSLVRLSGYPRGGFGRLVRCLRAERLRPGFLGDTAVNRVASRPTAQAVRTSTGRCPLPGRIRRSRAWPGQPWRRQYRAPGAPATRTPVAQARRAGGASAVAPA